MLWTNAFARATFNTVACLAVFLGIENVVVELSANAGEYLLLVIAGKQIGDKNFLGATLHAITSSGAGDYL